MESRASSGQICSTVVNFNHSNPFNLQFRQTRSLSDYAHSNGCIATPENER